MAVVELLGRSIHPIPYGPTLASSIDRLKRRHRHFLAHRRVESGVDLLVELYIKSDVAVRFDLMPDAGLNYTPTLGVKLQFFYIGLQYSVRKASFKHNNPSPGTRLGAVTFKQGIGYR